VPASVLVERPADEFALVEAAPPLRVLNRAEMGVLTDTMSVEGRDAAEVEAAGTTEVKRVHGAHHLRLRL
jgi:hypothetical protein